MPGRTVGPFGVLVIEVTRGNTLVHMVAQDPSILVIAQLAVDTGKTMEMTYLTPAPLPE